MSSNSLSCSTQPSLQNLYDRLTNQDQEEFDNDDIIYEILKAKVIIVPKRFLAEKTVFYLKNTNIINEEIMNIGYERISTPNGAASLQSEDVNHISDIMQFKYIESLHHLKEKNQTEFIIGFMKDYDQSLPTTQYLIERFKSFGNQEYKKFADEIENIEKMMEQLNLPNQEKLIQNQDFFTPQEEVIQHVQQIFNEHSKLPLVLGQFHVGSNNRLIDLLSMSYNKKIVNLMGFLSIEEFINYMITYKTQPEFIFFENFMQFDRFQSNFTQTIFNNQFPAYYDDDNILFKDKDGNFVKAIHHIKYIKVQQSIYMMDLIEVLKEEEI